MVRTPNSYQGTARINWFCLDLKILIDAVILPQCVLSSNRDFFMEERKEPLRWLYLSCVAKHFSGLFLR